MAARPEAGPLLTAPPWRDLATLFNLGRPHRTNPSRAILQRPKPARGLLWAKPRCTPFTHSTLQSLKVHQSAKPHLWIVRHLRPSTALISAVDPDQKAIGRHAQVYPSRFPSVREDQ